MYFPITGGGGHYKEMTLDMELTGSTGYVFKGILDTDDMITESDIQLLNLNYGGPNEDISGYRSIEMEDPNVEFLVFYDEGDPTINHKYSEFLTEVANYSLCNVYKAAAGELYFAYPMSMIDSTVSFIDTSDDDNPDDQSYEFYVKGIPLIGRKFLMDETNMSQASSRINDHYDFLQKIMLDITANFSIALRFFNTYGRSSTFTISNGKGNYETLNRTNCDIWLSIQFTLNTNVVDILPDVKHTIKTFIESISDTDTRTGINKISMSSLLRKLHDTYPNEIDYVIFNSINGYDSGYQNIVMNYDLTADENHKMIPEYLTLAMEDIKITVLDTNI